MARRVVDNARRNQESCPWCFATSHALPLEDRYIAATHLASTAEERGIADQAGVLHYSEERHPRSVIFAGLLGIGAQGIASKACQNRPE